MNSLSRMKMAAIVQRVAISRVKESIVEVEWWLLHVQSERDLQCVHIPKLIAANPPTLHLYLPNPVG